MFNFNNVVKFENKRFDVFAIGELLVDMISDDYDADNSCNKYSRYFGGSPANITMNIKRLGGNPIISASVGNDRLGEFLINNLKKNSLMHNARGAGRKAKFTDDQVDEIRRLREDGNTIKEIAKRYNCSVGLIHKLINEK